MATATLTPYKYHHVWVHSYYVHPFSKVPSTNQGADADDYDATQYIGDPTEYYDEETKAAWSAAVCIEYNVSLSNAVISSITLPVGIEIYVDGSDNHCYATLSTQAPTTNENWKFLNNNYPATSTRLGSVRTLSSTTSSLTFSGINKTLTASKIYLYLQSEYPNTWDKPYGASITRNYGNGTVNYTTGTYIVSYNANGGNSTPSSQTVTVNSSVTLASAISKNNTVSTIQYTLLRDETDCTITGGSNGKCVRTISIPQTFEKWHKDSVNGVSYNAGASFTPTANTVMYAGWTTGTPSNSYSTTLPTATSITKPSETITRNIVYNPNGGFSIYTSQTFTQTYSYTWDGKWYTSASNNGTQVTTSSHFDDLTIVYPHFNVTISGNSSTDNITFPTSQQCSREGYELLGWSENPTALTATYLPGSTHTLTASMETFYAVWRLLEVGFIHIYKDSTDNFKGYQPYIYTNNNYYLYDVYLYDGSDWVSCGGDPYSIMMDSNNNIMTTSDDLIIMVYDPDNVEK